MTAQPSIQELPCRIYRFPRSRIVVPPAPPVGYRVLQRVGHFGAGLAHAAGALLILAGPPYAGSVLLWVVAAGLAVHAVWRFVQALVDPEWLGTEREALMKRGLQVGIGVGFTIGALVAASLPLGYAIHLSARVAAALGAMLFAVGGVLIVHAGAADAAMRDVGTSRRLVVSGVLGDGFALCAGGIMLLRGTDDLGIAVIVGAGLAAFALRSFVLGTAPEPRRS